LSRHRLGDPAGLDPFTGIPTLRSMVVLTFMSVAGILLIIYSVMPGERRNNPVPSTPRIPGIVGALPEPSAPPSMADASLNTSPSISAGASASASPDPSASPSASPSPGGTTTAAPPTVSPRATTRTARPPAPTVTANYAVRTDWGDGFVADIVVRNATAAPATWFVDLAYSRDVYISGSNTWNATVEVVGGTYRFRGTAVLQPGETVQFGFVASKFGGSSVPSSCTVNGRACP
jgi:hypothetical protein